MDPKVLAMYEACPRFDEGRAYQEDSYELLCIRRERLLTGIADVLPDGRFLFLLEELLDILNEITEYETRYYFAQGVRMEREGIRP